MKKEQLEYAIKNYKEIAKQEHYTKKMIAEDHADGFFYDDALDAEGFFLLSVGNEPYDIAFDYGDTSSNGILLHGVDPRDSLSEFQKDLLKALNSILLKKS